MPDAPSPVRRSRALLPEPERRARSGRWPACSAGLLACLLSSLVALGFGASPRGRVAARPLTPHAPSAWILLDSFEDPGWPDPNLWQLERSQAPAWWPSSCQAKGGSRALWAFGGQIGEFEQPCGAGAPRETRSTIYQRLDLREATGASRLDLYFDLWLQMPEGLDAGLFIFLHVPEPDGSVKRVPIFGATGNGGRWAFPTRKLDLMNLTDITAPAAVYDLRGDVWRLEWVGLAPQGTAPGAGVYIDELLLAWEPDPGIIPPTPRPTSPPPTRKATATATRPPSATPRPASPTPSITATSAPSLTPISFGRTYLPYLASFWPPLPTDTPEPTPDETATAAAGTPEATATEGPSPTPSASVTTSPSEPGPPVMPTSTSTALP